MRKLGLITVMLFVAAAISAKQFTLTGGLNNPGDTMATSLNGLNSGVVNPAPPSETESPVVINYTNAWYFDNAQDITNGIYINVTENWTNTQSTAAYRPSWVDHGDGGLDYDGSDDRHNLPAAAWNVASLTDTQYTFVAMRIDNWNQRQFYNLGNGSGSTDRRIKGFINSSRVEIYKGNGSVNWFTLQDTSGTALSSTNIFAWSKIETAGKTVRLYKNKAEIDTDVIVSGSGWAGDLGYNSIILGWWPQGGSAWNGQIYEIYVTNSGFNANEVYKVMDEIAERNDIQAGGVW